MADSKDEENNVPIMGKPEGGFRKKSSFFGRSDDDGSPALPKFGGGFKKTSSPFSFGRSTGAFSRAAGTLKDRLKSLSKKDLAFVAMGLSVLTAAPVAEHMISAPSTGSGELTAGFGDRRSSVAGSVYEPGINALSQGSPDGSGDIITPLSSRDPMSLIMGPSQPQSASAPPPPPSSGGMRDSMREVARESMARASKSAGTPTVIPKMQTAFRGISSVLGGGGGAVAGRPLGGGQVLESAKNASGKAAKRSMVGPVAGPDYKGVASSQNSANKGAFENLRGQAERASSNFSGSSGIGSLEKAAAESMDAGAGSGGITGSAGERFGRPPGSSTKDARQIGGESLAQMAARMRMQKALEWEFYKKYEIPKKVIDAMIGYVTGALKDDGKGDETSEADLMGEGKGQYCGNLNSAGKCITVPLEYCNGKKISCSCDCYFGTDPNGGAGYDGTPTASGSPAADTASAGGGTPGVGGAAGGGSGGSSGWGGTPGSGTPGMVQAPNPQVFDAYDETLKQMYMDATEGASTEDSRVQLKCALQLSGAFTNLRVDQVVQQITAGADKTMKDAVVPFDQGISNAAANMSGVQKDVQAFSAGAAADQRRAESGSLDLGTRDVGGISVQAQQTQEIAKGLSMGLTGIKATEGSSFASAEEALDFFRQASELYKKQLNYVKNNAGQVLNEYSGKVLPRSREITNELQPLRDKHLLSDGDKQRISERFDELRGPEMYEKAILWRGADPGSYAGGDIDAERSRAAEEAGWKKIDPVVKYRNHEAIADEDNLAKANLFSALMRGYPEAGAQAGEIYTSAKTLINEKQNLALHDSIKAFRPVTQRMGTLKYWEAERWHMNN